MTSTHPADPRTTADLLAVYDELLREPELRSAESGERVGPVLVARYSGGVRGFVTYRDLGGLDAAANAALVAEVVTPLQSDPQVRVIEWKTRGHDHAPGLDEALRSHGFAPQEVESVMIGEATGLAVPVPLPEGVALRRVEDEEGVRAAERCAATVFGGSEEDSRRIADELVRQVTSDDHVEMWVAEADGEVVSSGRLEVVGDTGAAGIWGGVTLPEWRGQGIYRALTAERARSALARGVRWIHSDSTEYSRPILERSGLVRVTTATPYEWRRA